MKRYAILIGNSEYDEPSLDKLRCPGTDVDEMAAVLEATDLGDFSDVRPPLKDQLCEEVRKTIDRVLTEATRDDLVLIYFSGHGVLDENDDLYLATKDTDKQHLRTSAVRVREIRDWIDNGKCRRNVLILDCCHAGAAGRKGDIDTQLKHIADAGHGFYILSACTAIQTAKEQETDANSLYTKHLLEGIRTGAADSDGDGWISAVDLHDYIHGQLGNMPGQEPDMWPAPSMTPVMDASDVRGKLLIAKSALPRTKRGEMLHAKFAPLISLNVIKLNDPIASEALSLAEKPLRELTDLEERRDALIDEFLQGRQTFTNFRDAWLKAGASGAKASSAQEGGDDLSGQSPRIEDTPPPLTKKPGKGDALVVDETTAASPVKKLSIGFIVLVLFGLVFFIEDIARILGFSGNPEPESVTVPELIGLDIERARALLAEQGLTVSEPEERFESGRTPGTVIRQTPNPGDELESGAEVKLVIASSPDEIRVFRDPLKDDGQGPEMVMIRAGEFLMGSPENEIGRQSNERQHAVTIKQPFAIGKHEVTVGEFRQFVEATDYQTEAEQGDGCYRYSGGWQKDANANWKKPGFGQDENHPVVCVSWNDAMAYVNWVSDQTGFDYRLPTEAEWEYAARAGTTTPFWTGECIHTDQANYDGNFDYDDCGAKTGVYRQQTVPVGSLPANPRGLHEVHGNVWEWTCSAWDANYGGAEQRCDAEAARRAVRGGSWNNNPARVRSANRNRNTPDNRNDNQGFRLARPPARPGTVTATAAAGAARVTMSPGPGLAGKGAPNSTAGTPDRRPVAAATVFGLSNC